jgi:hypothetical protein
MKVLIYLILVFLIMPDGQQIFLVPKLCLGMPTLMLCIVQSFIAKN